MYCTNCGNNFYDEEGICSDCETELRAAAKRTPLELAAEKMWTILNKVNPTIKTMNNLQHAGLPIDPLCWSDLYSLSQQIDNLFNIILDNPSPRPNPAEQDERKSVR